MKKIDSLLKKVEFFERLAVYGDRKSFLKAIAQDASFTPFQGSTMVGDSGESTVPSGGQTQTTKEVVVVANPPIDKKVQHMLNELLVPHGDIFPLAPDGEMGPKTKDALKKFEARYGKPGTPAAVAETFKAEKNSQVAKAPVAPGGIVQPMGPGLGGIGDTKSSGIGEHSSSDERKVEGPKA